MKRGKLIALLGVNHSGKSTQAELLTKAIEDFTGHQTFRIKYPVYNGLHGEEIQSILRNGIQDPYNFQMLCSQNRKAAEPDIKRHLQAGSWVIAEGYYPDTYVWGYVDDIPGEALHKIVQNDEFLEPDHAIYLVREFPAGFRPEGHTNEIDVERLRNADFAFRFWGRIYATSTARPLIYTTDEHGNFRDAHVVSQEILSLIF